MATLDFQALPAHERQGLALLALYGSELSRSSVAHMLYVLGVQLPNPKRSGKVRATATILRPILERWQRNGWVDKTSQDYWTILSAAQHTALAAAHPRMLHDTLETITRHTYPYDDRLTLLEARCALYADDTETLRDCLRGDKKRGFDLDLLGRLIPFDAPAAAYALAPPDIRQLLIENTISCAIRATVRLPEGLTDTIDGIEDTAKIDVGLHQYETLRRNEPPSTPLDESLGITHEAYALAKLARGDVDGARASCGTAWERSSGPKKTRKNRLDSDLAPLLTLLLATGDTSDRALAHAQLYSPTARKQKDHYKVLELFLERPHEAPTGAVMVWQNILILGLTSGWTETSSAHAQQLAHVLLRESRNTQQHGFDWCADQLRAAAQTYGAIAEAPRDFPLTKLYTKKQQWELTLDALETELEALSLPEHDDHGRTERLVWQIDLVPEDEHNVLGAPPDTHNCGTLQLHPRLQKRGKRGWTKGRAIALERLSKARGDEAWMTPDDLRVTAHISVRRDNYYYGATVYEFGNSAARALIGHPRVVWHHDLSPVEITEGRPSIRIERTGRRIKVRFHPRGLASSPVLCERTGPNQLTVYAQDGAPGRLLEVIGREVDVPADAEPRIEQLVARLAPLLPVHSDIDAAEIDAEDVDADPRPVIDLIRHGDGMSAQISVLPLGEAGPRGHAGEGAPTMLAQVDGRTVRARRDFTEEKRRRAALFLACPDLRGTESGGRAIVPDLIVCLELLESLHTLRDDVIVRWREGDRMAVAGNASSSGLRLQVATADEWFSANGEVEVDESLVVDLRELLSNLPRRSGRFVPLDDQRFIAISADLERRLETLQAARIDEDDLNLHPVAASVVAGWVDEIQSLKLDRRAGRRLKLAKEAYTKTFEIPSTLDANLRDYQREGILWMLRLAHWGGGACLADDMGLGKTVQALAVLLDRARLGPALVVAPTSVCAGWLEQAARFAPALRPRFVASTQETSDLGELGNFDVVICSYAVMTRAIDHLENIEFASVVLDEAQAIKNATTRRAKAAFRLKRSFAVATTGTPIENRLSELWSLMRFLNPGFLGTAKDFDRRFVKPVQADGDPRALAQLRALAGPFILRRNKRDVLSELPPRTEIVLEVQPTDEERAFTEALRRNALAKIAAQSNGKKQSAMHVLAELTRLRLAACAPALVDGGDTIVSSKLRVFSELVDELIEGGHRALVFSQFVSFLSHVRARLDQAKVSYQYLDGSTPAADRRRAVDAFQGGEGELFLISLKAGGTGLNLTAADYVIHLDPWWNPAVEDQASDRAHRIGQQRPVTVYRLVTKGTVEERVLDLHHDKRELAAQLLAERDQARPLDAEALLALLGDAPV